MPRRAEQRLSLSSAGLPAVSSVSPTKIEFAPAKKQSACNSSLIDVRPAESRTIERGIMMRASAMVRTNSSGSMRLRALSSGVPGWGSAC